MAHTTTPSGYDWLDLQGTICAVTGAGSGIGAEVARQLAAAGAWVALLDRNHDAAVEVTQTILQDGGTARAIHTDIGDPASVTLAASEVLAHLGPCRVLVNNAAVRHRAGLLDIRLEDWNRVLSVNLTGALLCTQAFGAQMVASGGGGSIIHVSSLVSHHPQFDGGAYSASKASLNMLSRTLALELGQHRIRSNVVSPGFVVTPANAASYSDPVIAQARREMVPARRIADPVDLANMVLFLASERSSYVDGQEIQVDGGVSLTAMSRAPKAQPPGKT
jgi:NAD(P)-dependent dehydrogenase (short-subunit alcohol dehydrogenase family)